ncbi:MAG: MmcQ/YjbR family DNA-binding protein [Rhodobacteraceae bacterium]|nr:MmcQ/YjbR family DNA-binding protein [Paracoccaceae bacterium]
MTRQEFDTYCEAMISTTHVVQWGGASVWKVGGKIFAICSHWGEGDHAKIGFKCSDLAFAVLSDMAGIIPAPYLARAKWVQVQSPDGMSDQSIKDHIDAAYDIIAAKLTKAQRATLGIVTSSKGI